MPELPEVETLRRSLARHLVGRIISSVTILAPHVLTKDSRHRISQIIGASVSDVNRTGKCLAIELNNDRTVLIHLRMTGRLLWNMPAGSFDGHVHVVWTFSPSADAGDPEDSLVYRDVRKFGRIDLVEKHAAHQSSILQRAGPDILSVDFEDFSTRIRARRSQIKYVLLDQQVMAGVGNIYADEILFDAGIHPRARTANLTADGMQKLYASTRRILEKAIECGGSSIRDYIHTDGEAGRFQEQHRIYQRGGETCFLCGAVIQSIKVGGRTSSFCPRCQRRSKAA